MIRISDLKLPLTYDNKYLIDLAVEKLHIDTNIIKCVEIFKRSVNHSNKDDINFKATINVSLNEKENTREDEIIWQSHDKTISKAIENFYTIKSTIIPRLRPIVTGCGPAGLFAALILAQAGARPILLERGLDVDKRKKSVSNFWKTGILDINSNVQFGEGGAGAFSDGKLKIGSMDPRKVKVIDELIKAGAPYEIAYLAKPHIGTDRLHVVVKEIRNEIINLGGEVHFNSSLTEIFQKDGQITGIGYIEKSVDNEIIAKNEIIEKNKIEERNKIEEKVICKKIETDNVILAIGHSARDTFANLLKCGVKMEQRPIAIGVRIEHPQSIIDKIKYGKFAGRKELGAADYKMVVHLPNGRGVYTFCMCPGGSVIAATSNENCLVTNGMSEYDRAGDNSNTALLVTIEKNEFLSDHPLAGMKFQQNIEETAFLSGGGGYKAPVQRLADFMNKKQTSMFGSVLPTYLPGTTFCDIDSYLPGEIANSLRQAILEMDEWMPGFAYPDALLTGAETRSSSAVCIPRDKNYEAIGIKGLYPCGEGAGYAGGIISAAVDGIRCAERILGF